MIGGFRQWEDIDDPRRSRGPAPQEQNVPGLPAVRRLMSGTTGSGYGIDVQNREQEVGLIFNLTNQLEERILLFKYDMSVVDFIEKLIAENFLKEENFPLYIRQYIKAKSTDSKRDQHLLLTSDKKSKQAVIYQGNKTSQWDDKLLKRTRGGLIQSIVKGRNNLLMKKHFIFPVKSIDGKRARFIYRSELGKTILKNLK